MSNHEELVHMTVKGLMLDPVSNVPMLILRDEEGNRFLPIWIGVAEANAIAIKLEGVEVPRPMTHDLTLGLLTRLGAEVVQVVVNDLSQSTFFAQLVLRTPDGELNIDCRPSDGIALALRAEVPILVAPSVLEKAKHDQMTSRFSDKEKIKKYLEELDEDDLGEYTM
ncbi:MAG: bifunctional nuclease family protein [Holophagales bacterium]|nr:bifunctional nuclease family protein [Holophagales bacterium]